MYARYIPPPKGTPSIPAVAPSSQLETLGTQEPTHTQPKKTVFGDDFPLPEPKRGRHDNSEVEAPNGGENSSGNTQKAPRKKRKAELEDSKAGSKRSQEIGDASRKAAEGTAKHEEATEPECEHPVNPEPKKPKREKKKKAIAESDDTVRARHKSVFEKVERALQFKAISGDDGAEKQEPEPEVEVHGLEPLPQPEPVAFDESRLTYETLPPWLASPIRVTNESRQPFSELGIAPESARILESKGLKGAFAVQTAVLPLLLPSADRQGDVVVAAPTGSGKTLSYVLPMVQDISKGAVTRLRAVIVLPTRELVQQVQSACEACVAAFAIGGGKKAKVGTAVGNRVFKDEQAAIMAEEQRYDPQGYAKYLKKQRAFVNMDDSDDSDDVGLSFTKTKPLPYHTIAHISKVDILICTPGRLVEHVNKTPGFTLDYVRWLVVDEADKLLAQDFQQWLDVVLKGLSTEKPTARDFPGSNKTGPRKVVLSATMTRDVSLLNLLKLSRPRLVLLEGSKAGELTLPPLLKESAIKVREPSHKPLYLVDLLHSEHLATAATPEGAVLDSEASNSDTSFSDSSDSSSESESASESEAKTKKSSRPKPSSKPSKLGTVLIFTKSNESALRLSRLLEILSPELAVGTLTSSTKTSKRQHTLRQFAQGKLRILVASDLVSRGIDLANLDHVVNYDLPISETSYVHRVGRTARAGRAGHAWTLWEDGEGHRFWSGFVGEGKGGATNIVRSNKVERVRLGGEEGKFSEERIKVYEEALEQLRKETAEGK
ncbi:hypothetical protein OQA88_11226 [Cercophora sp. LCS_1]